MLQQVRDGHDAGFTELYLRHRGVARRVAATYRYAGDPDDLVNEAFEKVFAALRRGSGPTGSFRAYLLVTLRRLAGERVDRRHEDPFDDVPEPVAAAARHPALPAEDRELINRAFESLPDRAQAVLWYTAVEGRHPRELSGSFGMSPNAVSALAYRAREQLRQAYLQAHLQTLSRPQCEPHRSGLGAYVRDGQSRRDRLRTEQHVEHCPSCRGLVAELHEVNRLLVRAVVPVFLLAPAAPVAAAAGAASAAGAAAGEGAAHAHAAGAAAGRAAEAALTAGDTVRRLPTALGWLKASAPVAGGVAATAALLGGLAATGTLLFRDDAETVDVVPAAAPSAPPTPTTTPAPATATPQPRSAAAPARPCQTGTVDGATTSASPPTTATTAPDPASAGPPATTGLSLRLPLLPDVPLPGILGTEALTEPVLTLAEPVCTVDPADDRGELTLAVAGAGIGTEAPQSSSTTAAPLVDLAAAGVELTIDLSDGALAVDAELPAGCELLDSGHTVRCTVDEALLGSGTTLGLELLSEHEIATVSLRQGDQTLDVRAVELLQGLTGPVLPPSPPSSGTTSAPPASSTASPLSVPGLGP